MCGSFQRSHERVPASAVVAARLNRGFRNLREGNDGVASVVIADAVGMEVFATGGIGGVHREVKLPATFHQIRR